MKIKSLAIENFLRIRQAQLDLSAPVNIFLGSNKQGKSSIRDAVRFAFTGLVPTRGYTKKNQAGKLATRGSRDGMSVTVETDQGMISRNEKAGTKLGVDPQIMEIVCNPQAVLEMKPADRQTVFGALFRHTDTTAKIDEYLSKTNGFSPEVYKRCHGDLGEAKKWAVEQRRIAKRVIEELAEVVKHAPASVIEVDGRTFDFAKLNMSDLDGRIQQRTKERDELVKRTKNDFDPEWVKQNIAALEADLKGLNRAALEAELESTQRMFADTEKKRSEGDRRVGELKGELNLISNRLKVLKSISGGCDCPTCGQKVDAKTMERLVRELENAVQLIEFDMNDQAKRNGEKSVELSGLSQKLTAIREKIGKLDADRRAMEKEIERFKLMLKDAEGTAGDDVAAKMQEVDDSLAKLQKIKAGLAAYLSYQQQNADIADRRKKAEGTVEQMDKLDGLLKPDGELQKIANDTLQELEFDGPLQVGWGMESLKLDADGSITFEGDPIEAASDSEKFEAGILLAELLSRQMNQGILILDGLDILDPKNRNVLFSRLPNWMTRYKTILLLSTVPQKPTPAAENWLAYWWVEDGEVIRIGENVKVSK